MNFPPPLPLSAEAQRIAQVVTAEIKEQLAGVQLQLQHMATKVEVTGAQCEAVNDRMERRMFAAEQLVKRQQSVADKLFQGYMAMATAKAKALIAPTLMRLGALTGGALLGGFAATWLWWTLHTTARVAMFP